MRRHLPFILAGIVAVVAVIGIALYQIRGNEAQTGGRIKGDRAVQMLRLTNAARIGYGIQRLERSAHADKLAKKHSRKMANQNNLFHSNGYAYRTWAENIGEGSTVYSLFKAFMHSPPHRVNMLARKYHHLGVGFVSAGATLWVTMVFYG